MNVPEAVGIPEIVITLAAHEAVTPAGSPVGAPIPVAPVVAMVIGVSAVFIQSVGFEDGVPAVLVGVMLSVSVAVFAQSPAVGVNVYVVVAVLLNAGDHVPVTAVGRFVDVVGNAGIAAPLQ